MRATLLLLTLACCSLASGQTPAPDWRAVDEETLRHFRTVLQMDSSGPPDYESKVAEYVRATLAGAGIDVKVFAKDPKRPNIVARLRGSGARKPILYMAHTDTVGVQPDRWTFSPFSATRNAGYIYGRGATDNKHDVAVGLSVMLQLKRLNVPLDRDVIFLAESGEEGDVEYGIKFMVENHWPDIEAEFAIAEGGDAVRKAGKELAVKVVTAEKSPNPVELVVKGTAGHGSVPLADNAIGRLSKALGRVADWQPPMRLNDTTRTYFERLATISSPAAAERYNGLLNPEKTAAIQEYLRLHEPTHNSMLRTSISLNMVQGGYRVNVIPSLATATLDIRALPDENIEDFLAQLRRVINDPSIEMKGRGMYRPKAPPSAIDTPMFRAIENAQRKVYPGLSTLPSMLTGATDMSFLRAKGVPSSGIGPMVDSEDIEKGFGPHSDQERLQEADLFRYSRFVWEIVTSLAARQR